ncbi:MAG: CvpA family protein [Syntrophomonadaceae bacterium]|nr:CvpA family protein [Syntrophomonadaceae bacterium]
MNPVDIIVLVIIALSLALGWRKGFISALSGIIALIGAVWLAWRNKLAVYVFLQERFQLAENLSAKLGEAVPLLAYNPAVHPEYADAGAGAFWLASGASLPVTLLDSSLLQFLNGLTPAEYLAGKLTLALSLLLIFVLAYILLRAAFWALNLLFSFGPLSIPNRLLGGALGLLKGALLVWILLLLSSPFLEFASYRGAEWPDRAATMIEESSVLSRFDDTSAALMEWLAQRA